MTFKLLELINPNVRTILWVHDNFIDSQHFQSLNYLSHSVLHKSLRKLQTDISLIKTKSFNLDCYLILVPSHLKTHTEQICKTIEICQGHVNHTEVHLLYEDQTQVENLVKSLARHLPEISIKELASI